MTRPWSCLRPVSYTHLDVYKRQREDTAALGGAKGTIYTISDLVSRRLWEANGIPSTPLYCPLDEPESFSLAGYGDYVFYPSRVNALKRQSLLVEAMAYTRTPVRLLLAGRGDSGEEEKRIMALIRGRRLQEKVTYENRFISQEEKLHHLARCLAVAFVPVEEDYGYITPEAFASHKAVLTCTDSGGPLAFVEDGVTGFVRPPEPRALARALDGLYVHRERTAAMGQMCIRDRMCPPRHEGPLFTYRWGTPRWAGSALSLIHIYPS